MELAQRPHNQLPTQAYAEAHSDKQPFKPNPSQLFQYYLLDSKGFEPNPFTSLIPGVKAFDPFPFGILALVISSELPGRTIFGPMSQNRMALEAEKRSHLDLQVGMLAEQELTAMPQGQHKICQRLGIDAESARHELKGFSDATDVGKLASDLEDRLPDR